jgi:hypothetical protein
VESSVYGWFIQRVDDKRAVVMLLGLAIGIMDCPSSRCTQDCGFLDVDNEEYSIQAESNLHNVQSCDERLTDLPSASIDDVNQY